MRLSADSEFAYSQFVSRVSGSQAVWFLLDVENDYPACCESNHNDKTVFPFWSDRAYAKRASENFDFETRVDSIPLDNFLERTLAHISEINALVGPNWNKDLAGIEVLASDVLQALAQD